MPVETKLKESNTDYHHGLKETHILVSFKFDVMIYVMGFMQRQIFRITPGRDEEDVLLFLLLEVGEDETTSIEGGQGTLSTIHLGLTDILSRMKQNSYYCMKSLL